MRFNKILLDLYFMLLNLYPATFRAQFKGEMAEVFQQRLKEAGGFGQSFFCFVREAYALPKNLICAHWDAIGELTMISIRRMIQIHAAGFGAAFVLLSFLNFFTRYGLITLQEKVPPIFFYFVWLLFAGVLIGGLGGGAIALGVPAQRKASFLLACGLGYAVSLLLTSPSIWAELGFEVADSMTSFFVLGAPLLNGLCFGFVVGWAWKGWKMGLLFAFLSAIIFELGFWVNWLVLFVLHLNHAMSAIGSSLSEPLWVLLTGALAYLFFGAVVGILWGVLVGRVRRIETTPV